MMAIRIRMGIGIKMVITIITVITIIIADIGTSTRAFTFGSTLVK